MMDFHKDRSLASVLLILLAIIFTTNFASSSTYDDMLNAVVTWQSVPVNQAMCGTDPGGKLSELVRRVETCSLIASGGSENRIFNGCDLDDGSAFGWHVFIYFRFRSGSKICGGSLVSPRHVATAAHCVFDLTETTKIFIFTGTTSFAAKNTSGIMYQVAAYARHPLFTLTPRLQNDWALIELSEPVEFSLNVRPVCLPTTTILGKETGCIIAGHGINDTVAYTGDRKLRYTVLDILDPKLCRYSVFNPSNSYYAAGAQFCGTGIRARKTTDSCSGDSGSGFCCRINGKWTLKGIVSYGSKYCGSGPGMYSDVYVGFDMKNNAAKLDKAFAKQFSANGNSAANEALTSAPNWCCVYPTAVQGTKCLATKCDGPCFYASIAWSLKQDEIQRNSTKNYYHVGGCWDVVNGAGDEVMQKYLKFGGNAATIFGYLDGNVAQRIYTQANKNDNNKITTPTVDAVTNYLTNKNNLVSDLLRGVDPACDGNLVDNCNTTRVKSAFTLHEPNADVPWYTALGALVYNRISIAFCTKTSAGQLSTQEKPADCRTFNCVNKLPSNKGTCRSPLQTSVLADPNKKSTAKFDICTAATSASERGRLVDAITLTKDGSTYAFSGRYYWRLEDNGIAEGYPRLIFDDWPGLPNNIDAATAWASGLTLFFKGDLYWVFSNKVPRKNYPKEIASQFTNVPGKLTAAIGDPAEEGGISFIKDRQYWYMDYNEVKKNVEYVPVLTSKRFVGALEPIDTAVLWDNNLTYVFSGKMYSRYDELAEKVETFPIKYPRSTLEDWFGCTPSKMIIK